MPLRVVTSIFALGAFGTGIAYVLSYGLIRLAGATVSSMVTYFIPVASIASLPAPRRGRSRKDARSRPLTEKSSPSYNR